MLISVTGITSRESMKMRMWKKFVFVEKTNVSDTVSRREKTKYKQ
jgi:hypothetical protein